MAAATATAVMAMVTMDMAIGTATKTGMVTGIGTAGIGEDMATVAIGMVGGGAMAWARAGGWSPAAGFGSAIESKRHRDEADACTGKKAPACWALTLGLRFGTRKPAVLSLGHLGCDCRRVASPQVATRLDKETLLAERTLI
jgi:hypothetical protein